MRSGECGSEEIEVILVWGVECLEEMKCVHMMMETIPKEFRHH